MAKRELVDKADIKIQIETDLYCFPLEQETTNTLVFLV